MFSAWVLVLASSICGQGAYLTLFLLQCAQNNVGIIVLHLHAPVMCKTHEVLDKANQDSTITCNDETTSG